MLDFFLAQLLTGKVKDLHPVVRDILHLGLYQIYELDKIPDSAAVNESVLLAKKYCRFQPKMAGLVNRGSPQCRTDQGNAENAGFPGCPVQPSPEAH